MKAYAIFDGGGVKGTAFAGCLKAAEERGIEFIGYGGTSAGSLVALLAYVGYSAEQIRTIMADELDMTSFFPDKGELLNRVMSVKFPRLRLVSTLSWVKLLYDHTDVLRLFMGSFGLYESQSIKDFLAQKVWDQFPNLAGKADFTFSELHQQKLNACGRSIPLKVVASDLVSRVPVVFSDVDNTELGVLDAVRASMTYPFLFRPMKIGDRFLVDGGLSINLPTHIFQKERRIARSSIMAFDLVESAAAPVAEYGIKNYLGDLMETALSSSQHVLSSTLTGVHHIPIKIPGDIDTLAVNLSQARKNDLYNVGYTAAASYFQTKTDQFSRTDDIVANLQVQHVKPSIVTPILRAIAVDFAHNTNAEAVRSHIMMAIDERSKVVVYQFGMDDDSDGDLVLDLYAGCSGRSWEHREVTIADLEKAKKLFNQEYGMTKTQQNKVPKDRQSMMSFPIFEYSGRGGGRRTKSSDPWRFIY